MNKEFKRINARNRYVLSQSINEFYYYLTSKHNHDKKIGISLSVDTSRNK